MLSIGEAYYSLKNRLQPLYGDREASSVAHHWLESVTGMSRLERIIYKDRLLDEKMQLQFEDAASRLESGEPLQYVTGIGWFMNKPYQVNSNVLIPRPETEELVNWVLSDCAGTIRPLNILDVGTGSGCISCALGLALGKEASITGLDVSLGAIAVAQENATTLGVQAQFQHCDFLLQPLAELTGLYDVIVSNPPYIPFREKDNLHVNVVNYEPSLALFVPDSDPLIFYKAISSFGSHRLKNDGNIYCEVEQTMASDCVALFKNMGWQVELRRDMHSNWRMLKAWRPQS